MISVEDALEHILGFCSVLSPELKPISDALGQILAEDIVGRFDMPRWDNSAMDGFAVRSRDTVGARNEKPVTLKMVSISAAGSPSDLEIGSGECAQCMTGAEIPKGADAVVMVEDTSGFSDSDTVKIFFIPLSSKNLPIKSDTFILNILFHYLINYFFW